MGNGRILRTALALLGALVAAGCGPEASGPPTGEGAGGGSASHAGREAAGADETSEVIRRHIRAINRGDVDAYLAEVAPDATFDIGGRTFEGVDEIRGFAEGEVAGGRYEILDGRPVEGDVELDLDFRRGGLYEWLTYRYAVEDGTIRGLVARYR